MNREDFSILTNKNYIYFDNAATSLKPDFLVNELKKYYTNYTSNVYRADYDNSVIVNKLYEETRYKVSKLINSSKSEVIFTTGTTHSINLLVFGFMKYYLKENDEVILNKAEHASNILPWIELSKEIGFKIVYAPLNDDLTLSVDSVKNLINDNTKVISIAHVTNVVGDARDLEEFSKLKKEHDLLLVVDAAQSVSYMNIDLELLDIDFLSFSAHKMYGPTGVGILYTKEEHQNIMRPIMFGGGMNDYFNETEVKYYTGPTLYEAGTPNVAGIVSFGKVLDYVQNISIKKINEHVLNLREYFVNKLSEVDNIIIYNKDVSSSIITFNVDGVFAQDVSVYLNKYNISIRAGSHCSKMLVNEMDVKNTCRVSLAFYNTYEEVDYFIEIIKNNDKILEEII